MALPRLSQVKFFFPVIVLLASFFYLSAPSPTFAACPSGTTDAGISSEAECTSGCDTTCYPDDTSGEKVCCAYRPIRNCPSGTTTYPDEVQCRNSCTGSSQCVADEEGVIKRCCAGAGAGLCPSFTNPKATASECASFCASVSRDCENDSDGVKRCAPFACTGSGGGGGGGGGGGTADEICISGSICFSTNPAALAGQVLEFGYGLGALFALLFIIIGGYEVATSAGDPDRLEEAKKKITAAISGLVFLLASALILRTIGCGLINIDSSIICG